MVLDRIVSYKDNPLLEEDYHVYYSTLLCLFESLLAYYKEVKERGVGSGKNSILVIVLVSLIVATGVSAAPTIIYYDNFSVTSPSPDAHILDKSKNSKTTELYNSTIASIGTEMLIPPADFTGLPSTGAGTFPPTTMVFIVLTGLLCVTLVIDRKLWPAILTAPLRRGQNGFISIPHLAGIPAGTIKFPNSIPMHEKIRQKQIIRHTIQITNAVLKFVIKHFSSLHKPALICMALSYEQNKSFSPAFIFVRLARGPPNPA